MKSLVSQTIRDMPPSGIRRFFDVASTMKDVVSLGVGEPDFATPWHIREEAIFSLEKRRTMYTSNAGMPALRNEISRYMSSRYGLDYSAGKQILVTVGASEGIDIAMRALINPGDEVLVVEPCFVSYKPCVTMAGGVPVPVPTDASNGFRVSPGDIEARITPRTKVLMISYPNNPTGATMDRESLEGIAAILRGRDIAVVSDEIYAELTYGGGVGGSGGSGYESGGVGGGGSEKDGRGSSSGGTNGLSSGGGTSGLSSGGGHVSIASLPGMYEKTVVINGFSKAYAMTGWRLGFLCGPEDIVAAVTKIHQYVLMCAPTVAQYGGIEALKNGRSGILAMRKEYDARRRFMLAELRKIGIECFEAQGAFYLFPSIRKFGLTSEEFCVRLLHEKRLAVVPGAAFGESGEGHIRCAYAYSVDSIKEALSRLREFVDSL